MESKDKIEGKTYEYKDNRTVNEQGIILEYKPSFSTLRMESIIGPSISGSVQVPLAELDRLRNDHAKAANIARDLLSHQSEVKLTIISQERENVSQYNTLKDSLGRIIKKLPYDSSIWKNKEIHVEYLNFEEFREIIRTEEYSKLELHIKQITESRDKIKILQQETAEKNIRLISDNSSLDKHSKDLDGKIISLDITIDGLRSHNESIELRNKDLINLNDKMQTDLVNLQLEHAKEIGDMKTKLYLSEESKGFWSNLFKLFDKK